jgi:undecaprenyl-diphosphatase
MTDQSEPLPQTPADLALDPQPAYWQATVLLVLAVLVARVLYLIFLCPYDLASDEAHYWEWSRHLALSYYSKGPGAAWCIAAATAPFGAHEWSVRLPAALFSALGALLLARLTAAVSGSHKAGFLAALVFCLVPAYQVSAQLMTIDGPFFACWIAASWVGWALVQRWRQGRTTAGLWVLLGFILGVGFLFKYSIVLFVPGLLLFGWLARRELRWDGRVAGGVLGAAVAFLAAISPVLIWNAQHGWPILGHELGHLGVGGDLPGKHWAFRPDKFGEFVGAQLGMVGIPAFIACVGLLWPWLRQWRRWTEDVPRLFLACCALPTLAFFLALSWLSPVEGNWPLAAYTTLFALLGREIVAREQAGLPRRTRLWRWIVGWGLMCGVLVAFPHVLASLPVVGHYVPMHRISGQKAFAARVQAAREQLARQTGRPPLIISHRYQDASWLAFYLPDRPVVFSAARYLGSRPSSYDYFPDTDLSAPGLRGRPAVLTGHDEASWPGALAIGPLTPLEGKPPLFLTPRYDGPRGSP